MVVGIPISPLGVVEYENYNAGPREGIIYAFHFCPWVK
jgi:hypothetical protein